MHLRAAADLLAEAERALGGETTRPVELLRWTLLDACTDLHTLARELDAALTAIEQQTAALRTAALTSG